jgi:hypothetical protein
MKTTTFLIVTTCLLVTLNCNVVAMDSATEAELAPAPTDNHVADLKQLEAWCPLDEKLTGLDVEYCNKKKGEEEKGPLLQASEARAMKVLFGTAKKGQECGLCSASLGKKGCGTTKTGVKVSFDIAIKADNYAMLNKWCLLGKANMELCRNFGSESVGKASRTRMCKDLKANKFNLDPLRGLEFGAGEDGPLADIVAKLGQNKVYSLLGLGGCLTLLEEKPDLLPIMKKVRPDAGAVICVKALAEPNTPVLDVVSEVFNGFIKEGENIVARHKRQFVKTNIGQVLKRISGMVKKLNSRQIAYTINTKTEKSNLANRTAKLNELKELETYQREALKNYTRRAEEHRKQYKAFKRVRGSRVVLPLPGSDIASQVFIRNNKTVVSFKRNKTARLNQTNLIKKIRQETGETATAAVKALVAKAIRQQEKKDKATYEAVEEAAKAKVIQASDEVAKLEKKMKEEVSAVRSGDGRIGDNKLKAQ